MRVSGWTLNGIWSFLRPCLQASRFPLKRVKDCPPLQAKCFSLNSGRSVSINVNKRREYFSRNIHGARMFPNVSQFPTREIYFPVSVLLFSRCKFICLRYTTGNFNENPSMRALTKLLRARARASDCEQFEQRTNFASSFKLDGTIRYAYLP